MSSPFSNPRPPVVLQIAGQRLRLSANADEKHLAHLAQIVNDRCATIVPPGRSAPPATLLALVALDFADELQNAHRKLAETKEEAQRAIAAAEARAREIEQMAKRAVIEAIAEIDRALELDEELGRKRSESESA